MRPRLLQLRSFALPLTVSALVILRVATSAGPTVVPLRLADATSTTTTSPSSSSSSSTPTSSPKSSAMAGGSGGGGTGSAPPASPTPPGHSSPPSDPCAPLAPGQTKQPCHRCIGNGDIQPPDGEGCTQPDDLHCGGSNEQIGECMAARRALFDDQWQCLDQLWGVYESGWLTHNRQPWSGADGIPQALPAERMADGGGLVVPPNDGSAWPDDPHVQIAWGIAYINGRYGSPCNALGARLWQGWY